MLNVVIFGAPGSGKGTQSELIVENFGLTHISTGEVLRGEIERQTDLGKIADEYISKGQLIPDDVIIKVLGNLIDRNPNSKGFIFDGFPRTIAQGEALDKILKERSMQVTVVLNLDVAEEELVQRLLKRGEECGRCDDNLETIQARLRVYHAQTEPLKEFYKKRGQHINIKGIGSVEDIYAKIHEVLDKISQQ